MKHESARHREAAASVPDGQKEHGVNAKKLPLALLTAIVIGSMLGSGIFSLPQNIAHHAGPAAVLLAWLISGVGMLMLALVYQTLALNKPDLNNGIYAYARASAGDFVGFHTAWGYWISAWTGNAAYWVIFFSTLGYFFPAFGAGNTPVAIASASLALWAMHGMILRGIHTATRLNAVITAIKIIVLLAYIVIVALAFQPTLFVQNFWGQAPLGALFAQVKSTLLVTVWVFIGIEGASVLSSRAQRRADIGRATLCGFASVLLLLMAISLLSFGILPQRELAALPNPSMTGVIEAIFGAGHWGGLLINLGLLVSVGGSLLAWTLLAAETLFAPARDGVMPRFLTYENPQGVPTRALWLTNGVTQILLLVTLASSATYLTLILLAAAMILMPYLFSAIYACRLALLGEGYAAKTRARWRDLAISIGAIAYCSWLLYGAGLKYLLLSALLYAPGNILYIWAKREQRLRIVTSFEGVLLIVQLGLAVVAIWLLVTHQLTV